MKTNKLLVRQPKFDVIYDASKGEIVAVKKAQGDENRPIKPTWLHANLQLTEGCNLACRYCRTNSSPKTDVSGELTTEQWIELFERLKEAGVRSVFATGGEIFNRSDIWQLLSELTKRFMTHVLCNGQFWDSRLTGEQKQILKRLASVQISIDRASAKTNDRFRGKGTWQKAVEAVKLVSNLGVEVVISSVVFPDRMKEVKEMAMLAQNLNAKLLLRPLLSQGRGKRMLPARCAAINVQDLYDEINLPSYARGFLAYSEELYKFGVNIQNVNDCGVVAFAPDGRQKNVIDE